MTGLLLTERYYLQAGRPALEAAFSQLLPRMAVGLAGEDSECFGFDDALSRDHNWGPAFCIWPEESDYRQYARQIQQVYDRLPGSWEGFPARQSGPHSQGRVGCLCTEQWFRRYTGFARGPGALAQ